MGIEFDGYYYNSLADLTAHLEGLKEQEREDALAVLNAQKNTGLLEATSPELGMTPDDPDYVVDPDTGAITTTQALADKYANNDFEFEDEEVEIEGVAINEYGQASMPAPDFTIAPDPVQYDASDFELENDDIEIEGIDPNAVIVSAYLGDEPIEAPEVESIIAQDNAPDPVQYDASDFEFTDEEMGIEEVVIEGVGTRDDGSLYVESPDLPDIVLPNEEPDPEWLAQKEQLAKETAAESDQAYDEADQTQAAYVALKEETKAIEAALAAGDDTVTIGAQHGADGVEFSAAMAADILKGMEEQEAEALQVATDARMAALSAGEAAGEAGKLEFEKAEQFYEDIAESQDAVYGSDIMQGGDVSADSLAELGEAALQARETLTTAVQDIDATERQVDSLEELAQEAQDLYETAEKAYTEVQTEVKKEADKETKETAALIDEFYGEGGLGRDDQDNITIGEDIDTLGELVAVEVAIDEQLADIEALLVETTEKFVDPDGDTQYDEDGNPISGMDAGVTVGATNAELLGAETISELEAQKEQLEALQGDLVAASELIKASDALIAAGGDPHAKSMQSFWTNAPKYDPKAQFRFKVIIGGTTNTGMALQDALGGGQDVSPSGDPYNDIPDDSGGSVWYAKSVDKPTIQFAEFAKGFHRMGFDASDVEPLVTMPTFSPINMVLIDPTYPNATRKLLRWIRRSGYNDDQVNKTNESLGQDPVDAFMNSIGDVQIQQLDSDGKVLEIWWLQEAFPAEINFGKLDYSSTDFVEISITWAYQSMKVQMMVKGAEEEFTYFNDFTPKVRGKPGDTSPCSTRWEVSKSSETQEVWQRGLESDDKCWLPPKT